MTEATRERVDPLALEREGVRVEVDPSNGAITGIGDRAVGLELIGNRARAESWRLLIPLPERRGHYVRGSDQTLRESRLTDDGITLRWGPLRSDIGDIDVDVELDIRIVAAQVEFTLSLDNRSDLLIEEAIAPVLAGITRPSDPQEWRIVGPRVISGAWEYPVFDEVPSSYHGPVKSNIAHPYPGGWVNPMSLGMPWVALEHSDGRAVYVANHDPEVAFTTFLVEFDAELRIDGNTQAAFGSAAPQRWPLNSGPDSTLTLLWALFPFLEPGERFQGPPVVVRFLPDGGWRAALEHFKQGFDARTATIEPRHTWLGDSDAWLGIALMFNDGTIDHHLADLPGIAADAAASGITTLLIVGWSTGGLDKGYPIYRIDPRLGTDDEFREVMQQCRDAGVRVLLFAQLQQVCAETEWFRSEGHRYLVQNAAGDPYYCGGVYYGFNTLLDHLGYSAPQILTANPAHSGFREFVLNELYSMVELGADGILIDKLHTGDPYSLDYNPSLPGTPATRFHRALHETVGEFVAEATRRNPDLAIAAESGWDVLMPYCEASYSRYFERDHLPLQELAFPDCRLTTTVVTDNDFNMVNNALRYGHVICIEPQYYHGDAATVPNLARYMLEVHRLRQSLRPLLWNGRLVESPAIDVDGAVLHNVFQRSADAEPDPDASIAVVLNHFEEGPEQARVAFPPEWHSATVHRPFRATESVELPITLTVPPEEYVVIVPHTVAAA